MTVVPNFQIMPLSRDSPPLRGSHHSLVSGSDVTPAALEVWRGLPEEVRSDPVFGPFCRVNEGCEPRKNGHANMAHGATSNQEEDGQIRSREQHAESETRPLNGTEQIEMRHDKGQYETYSDTFIGSGVKKKESPWARGQRYCKISFLLGCWAFYSSILLLYSEKETVERHTSLAAGEIKTYPIHTKAESLRVWVELAGPFWSDLQQKKYKQQLSEEDSYMEAWLESEQIVSHNGSETSGGRVQKSKPWIVCLLDHSLIDFSEGEPRSIVLKLDQDPKASKDGTLHSFSIKMRHNANSTVPFTVTYTKNPLDPNTGIIYAAILLIGLYAIIIFDLINRTLAAIIVSSTSIAVLALAGERPSMLDVLSWMDSETLLLLFSMMLLVTLMAETGVFDYLAVVAFERTRGETWPLINLLYLLTIVVSLFLDNVTTVLLLTPATIRLCEVTGLDPVPILMGMVIFCNVGGTATPVGDPPNIIIATNPIVAHAGINFTNFTLHMSLGVGLVFIQTYLQFRFMYRDVLRLSTGDRPAIRDLKKQAAAWRRAANGLNNFSVEENLVKKALEKKLNLLENQIQEASKGTKTALPQETFEKTLKELKAKYKIRDKTLLIQTMVAITFIVVVFFLHSLPQAQSLSLGWSALLGTTMLLVLADKPDLQPALSRVEWSTLLFFAALFICMEAITKLGLIQWIGGLTESLILSVSERYQLPVAILLVLWVSGVTSAFVDNIPLTSMMVRVVTSLGSNPALSLPMAPLIWALSFGACMGGNGTLVGASANVIAAGVAEQQGYRFTFKGFFRLGAPMTLGHLLVVSAYLLVAHCVFTWH